MSFPIPSSYQTLVMNPYKTLATASRSKSASRFETRDGDTVSISSEAYTLLENNMAGRKTGQGNRHTDRN